MTNLRGRRTLSLAAGAVSVLWLIGVAWYIFEFIGADSLAGMLPHELPLEIPGGLEDCLGGTFRMAIKHVGRDFGANSSSFLSSPFLIALSASVMTFS